jgi:CRP-like cAMP-binding protein
MATSLATHALTSSSHIPARPANRLLSALADDDYRRIGAHLVSVPLKFKQVLYKQNAPINDVYFPGAGSACSVMKIMEDGAMTEVSAVGDEGVVGSCVYFGENQSVGEAIVQIEGPNGFRMSVAAFTAEMDRRDSFHELVVRHHQAMASQALHTIACNGLHTVEQRCCSRLLVSRDRSGHNELRLTHDFLSTMLGVRRPTITLTIAHLERAGVIATHRGLINIINTDGLEQMACECYAAAKDNFARLLPELAN